MPDQETYPFMASCGNCGWQGSGRQVKGSAVDEMDCPGCHCETLHSILVVGGWGQTPSPDQDDTARPVSRGASESGTHGR